MSARPIAFLEVRDVRKHYGAIKAVDGVTLRSGRARSSASSAPTARGKTTLFNSILGPDPADVGRGRVLRRGHHRHVAAASSSRRGVGRTFQTLQVFGKLSVRDNLIVAAQEFKGTMREPPVRAAATRAWARTPTR